jgi:hypothetical protein
MTKNRTLYGFLSTLQSKELAATFGLCAMLFTVLFTVVWSLPHRVSATQSKGKVATTVVPAKYADRAPKKIKERISHMGGSAMRVAAKRWGLTEIMGKKLTGTGVGHGQIKPKKLNDVGIGVDPVKFEDEPTVAANPANKKNLVAGSHSFDPNATEAPFVRCVAYSSFDGGKTWSSPMPLTQLTPTSDCSDPVLAFAPDGSRVYYAYLDLKFTSVPFPADPVFLFSQAVDVLVSFSDDGGVTWSTPVVALSADPTQFTFDFSDGTFTLIDPGFDYDKPWIGTHVDGTQSNHVYVTATRFDNFGDFLNHIAFTGSAAKGANGLWSTPTILETGTVAPIFELVQGSRPAGGLGGEVLVAWFHSGSDGFLEGSFEIHTRRSPDHGATWDPVTVASLDSFEVPFALGPFNFYYIWSGAMFPDVEIDSSGDAHLVYTHDPEDNPPCPPPFESFFPGCSTTPEDGDIRYISSAGPPYASWSAPVTVNDDQSGRAQGFAALKIQHDGALNVIWDDHRLSPDLPTSTIENCQVLLVNCDSPNLYYDIFYARKTPGHGAGWSRNIRVSDTSMINQFQFRGATSIWPATARRYLASGPTVVTRPFLVFTTASMTTPPLSITTSSAAESSPEVERPEFPANGRKGMKPPPRREERQEEMMLGMSANERELADKGMLRTKPQLSRRIL